MTPGLGPLRASQDSRDSELAESPSDLVDRQCDVDVGMSCDPDDQFRCGAVVSGVVRGSPGRGAVDSAAESTDLIMV
jgi:hypothetical protein